MGPYLAILGVMYLLTAVGVTVGFHRLLTHRAFQTYPWLERTFAVLGSLSVQGSVMDWVADHRKHHAHTDVEGDPHSPHVGHGTGLRGLWHAHVGWLLETQGQADWKRYAPDLYEDPGDAPHRPAVPASGPDLAARADARRIRAARVHARRSAPGLRVGRVGADLLRPSRHLVGQLGVPLLWDAQVRDRGPTRPMSAGWRCCRSASLGTTITTRFHVRPTTACDGGRSTSRG